MKRRTFGLVAGAGIAALKLGSSKAEATVDPTLLTTTLTPFGGERAGNADGSIPAWTGGMTTMPAGTEPNGFIGELFPDEQPVVIIDAGNMAQHADQLADNVKTMMSKYGFKIYVYPTHRTAAGPQYVYDNTAKNAVNAKFNAADPVGGRFGITGVYCGIAFPIPYMGNPLTTGAQIIWNVITQWRGYADIQTVSGWNVSGGTPSLASTTVITQTFPYYDPNGSLDSWSGWVTKQAFVFTAPSNLVGQQIIQHISLNPTVMEYEAWELLNGEARVRRAPELSFDTPAASTNGAANYDEFIGFNGSLERYDWKYIGKKEMYIPYNTNKLFGGPAQTALLANFPDPELVRWELHRCWVVEATLHPGERNVLARRVLYIDEDTWFVSLADEYDGNNNLYKGIHLYNWCRPDVPALIYGNECVFNLQADDYTAVIGPWDQKIHPTYTTVSSLPPIDFDPSHMAASAQY